MEWNLSSLKHLTRPSMISHKYFSDLISYLRANQACSCPDPELRRALHLVQCSTDAVLKVLLSFEPKALHFHFALGPDIMWQALTPAIQASSCLQTGLTHSPPASGIGQWLLLPSSEKAHSWEVYLAAPSLESPQQRSLLWSSRLHCHLSPDSKAFLQSLHLCPVLCCRFTWVQLVLVPVEVLPRDGTLPGLVIYLWDLTHFLAHRYISVHFCWVNTFLSNTMKVAYLTSTS